MAEERDDVILDLKIDRSQSEKELEGLTKDIERLKKETDELIKTNKDLKKSGQENNATYVENAKQIELNKDAINRNTSARKNIIQAIKAEDNSLAAIKTRLAENKRLRDQINLSTEEGRKRFQALTKAIKDDNDALLKAEKSAGIFNRQVGNYNVLSKEAIANSGAFGQSVVGVGDSLKGLANPITAGIVGLGALVKLYTSSTVGARDFKSAMDQLSGSFTFATNAFGKFIDSLSGGEGTQGGGILTQLSRALTFKVFGFDATIAGAITESAKRDIQETEVELLDAQRVAKDALNTAEELRRVRDDDTKSFETRMQAANDVSTFIDERENALVEVLKKREEAFKLLLSLDKENLELQKALKQVQFEIADIEEDSEGKRTEALNGIIMLEKERGKLSEELLAKEAALEDEARKIRLEKLQQRFDEEQELYRKQLEFYETFYSGIEVREDDMRKKIVKVTVQKTKQQESAEKELAVNSELINKFKAASEIGLMEQVFERERGLKAGAMLAFKADAIAEMTTNTYDAAVGAYKSMVGIPYVGPILAPIAAAAATAFGLLNIGRVAGINFKFAKGGRADKEGLVGGRPHSQGGTKYYGEDGHVVELEQNERWFVLNKSASGKINALSDLNVKHGGVDFGTKTRYAQLGGQIETRIASNNIREQQEFGRVVANELRNLPNPVVLVEDINTGQRNVAQVRSRAQTI